MYRSAHARPVGDGIMLLTARASVSFRSSNPNIIQQKAEVRSRVAKCLLCARANHHSYLQRACKCRVQSSGETKTVLIAAC